jgi:hypothetical protein
VHIEVIGILTIVLGVTGWFAGDAFATYALVGSTLLASAATIILSSLGGASIQPSYILLGFLTLRFAVSSENLLAIAKSLSCPHLGFWLLLMVTYAVIAAVFFPRLFAGTTYVFSSGRGGSLLGGTPEIPLGPTSTNITQSVYLIGDLICFLVFVNYASTPKGVLSIVKSFLIAAMLNLAFAVVDLVSYRVGAGNLLDFLRNADYRMLDDATAVGFKRIVGSFPEASTFAFFTVGFFAFSTKLWLDGIWPRINGPIALASLCALIFATSSTGYAAAAAFIFVLFVVSCGKVMLGAVRKSIMTAVLVLPLLVTAGLVGLSLYQPSWQMLERMVDESVLYKLSSNSGVERTRWNEQALTNFVDTYGAGAGVGSVRASSFLIALLGNVGVPGALLYGVFLIGVCLKRSDRWSAPFPAACQSAARWSCFAQLCGASVAGSFIDLGLPFFVLAGLACANPRTLTAPSAAPKVNALIFPRNDMKQEGA